MNPYAKNDPKHAQYAAGYALGKTHADMNYQAMGSRRWPYAYRIGYSDGYRG